MMAILEGAENKDNNVYTMLYRSLEGNKNKNNNTTRHYTDKGWPGRKIIIFKMDTEKQRTIHPQIALPKEPTVQNRPHRHHKPDTLIENWGNFF